MTTHQRADILDHSGEDLKKPFWMSVGVHVAVLAGLIGSGLFVSSADRWGSEDAGGGAIGIAVEDSIPLPQAQGRKNPLANDTPNEIPAEPEKPREKTREKDDALEKLLAEDLTKLKTSTKPNNSNAKDVTEREPNQLTSASGARLSSPLLGGKIGAGGVGVGSNAFGNQFGAYLQAVQQRIAAKWRSAEMDPRLRQAPPVLLSFEILRNGDVRAVRILQSGGNANYDLSAQRAVVEAGPFEPLPAAYKGSSALIEVAFKLER